MIVLWRTGFFLIVFVQFISSLFIFRVIILKLCFARYLLLIFFQILSRISEWNFGVNGSVTNLAQNSATQKYRWKCDGLNFVTCEQTLNIVATLRFVGSLIRNCISDASNLKLNVQNCIIIIT